MEICIIHMKNSNKGNFIFIKDTVNPSERFKKLVEIKQQRQSQPVGSPYRMDDVCVQIPSEYKAKHGYHRDCYSRFTSNLNRLKTTIQYEAEPSTSASCMVTRRSSTELDKVIFHPDCIFCGCGGRKKKKVKNSWTSEGLKSFEFGGGSTIVTEAEKKQDHELLRRISGVDLFACEAKFHPSCRANYYHNPERWRSKSLSEKEKQCSLEDAHRKAFQNVCEMLQEKVIIKKEILKLKELCNIYIDTLKQTPYPNPNYRGYKLKQKIEKCEEYENIIGFSPIAVKGGTLSYLVFNLKIDVSDAIRLSYILGSTNEIEHSEQIIRSEIFQTFEGSDELTWPPTADNLNLSVCVLPDLLQKFLTHVFTDRAPSDKVVRLVNSIGQDICRATTDGKWILPKHLLVGMTLRHWFRSAELIKLMNRFGHSENYSFLLEVETSLAEAISSTSDFLPVQIVRQPSCPALFHSDFDNFDVFVNDVGGAGSVHRAHGIMLQELCCSSESDIGGFRREIAPTPRTRHRSMTTDQQENPEECYMGKRLNPKFEIINSHVDGGDEVHKTYLLKNMLYILVRMHAAKTKYEFPGWGGYVSLTGDAPTRLTTIEYYPIIPHAITEYVTIQECLKFAEKASQEVGQSYVVTTFDLGVCMKAYPLIWNYSKRFEKHIVMIGTFHLVCGYMKMIGKKMDGSGFSDILLEAGLISSGSLSGVLSGKNYSRGINCHKSVMEALERLMLKQFHKKFEMEEEDLFPSTSYKLIENIIKNPSKESEQLALADDNIRNYLNQYIVFREELSSGVYGKTAALWTSYVNHVWLMLFLIQAVKNNDFLAYAQCLCLMPDIFFSFGGHNYARYLTYFSVFISNIETSHPGARELLECGAFSVARSFKPGNRCAVDKTIEETFMKHSKSRGGCSTGAGLSGFQTNYSAYQRWTQSSKERTKYLQATFALADMGDGREIGLKHRENHTADKVRSEKQVERTINAIESFQNPFSINDNRLYIISSGSPSTVEIEDDVCRAEEAGRCAKDEFISNRLKEGTGFFDAIAKMKLKTLANMNKQVKLTTSKNKSIQYKQQGDIAFKLLMKSQDLPDAKKLDIRHLLTYPLTPVPYSIGTADNFLSKTNKSIALHHLTADTDDSPIPTNPEECFIIEDGNAVFHSLTQIPKNFEEIAMNILNYALRKSPVLFSTDMYFENSIKSVERMRRGCGEKLIISGPKTTRPKDWKVFLSNDHNKEQLVEMLHKVWISDTSAECLEGHKVILIRKGNAYQLTSDGKKVTCEEISSLQSTQEETDSRVILYCIYARDQGFQFVRVRSPDTDIFFILLHFVNNFKEMTILFETGKGNKRRSINVTEFAKTKTPTLCSALLGLHAFTGCDTVSSFKGKGKKKPIKLLEKSKEFQVAFSQLGELWDIPDELSMKLEKFTCALYGKPRVSKVNEVRFLMIQTKCGTDLQKKSNFDLSMLPPCQNCLTEHIHRANYQVKIWKLANEADPVIPDPLSLSTSGWTSIDIMQPKWIDGDILPVELVDLLEDMESCPSYSDRDEDSDFVINEDSESGSDSDDY